MGWRLKVLDATDPMRWRMSQDSQWFGSNDRFLLSSLSPNLDFHVSRLKIQKQTLNLLIL